MLVRVFTVNQCFELTRSPNSSGWANQTYADKDAVVVDILRKAGAVLFVKTQNPQTLLVRNVYAPRHIHLTNKSIT
jgi:hypothetical protein